MCADNNVGKEKYKDIHDRAKCYLLTDYAKETTVCMEKYGYSIDESLKLENIMVMLAYCGLSRYQYNFSKQLEDVLMMIRLKI